MNKIPFKCEHCKHEVLISKSALRSADNVIDCEHCGYRMENICKHKNQSSSSGGWYCLDCGKVWTV